ncbi:hypothetical protein FCV25MIE_07672 [Fagus crenata]
MKQSQRRGPGRPPKTSHDKNKSGLANSFTAKIIRKPRTKANTRQVIQKGLSWGSQASNLHRREKEGDSKSGRDKGLIPSSSFDSFNVCIQDIDIPGPIPDFDSLIMDDSFFRNFFEDIP